MSELSLREEVARAIALNMAQQDYHETDGLDADLRAPWIDQGETDFGLIADAAIAAVMARLKVPTPTAIAFALPLTNEPDLDDWFIGDQACEILDYVNTDGELAAAQLCRDYKNVLSAMLPEPPKGQTNE